MFLAISRLKMVRFPFRKKLLEGKNVPVKLTMPGNVPGCLLGGVLRYLYLAQSRIFPTLIMCLISSAESIHPR